jgi:hypothetical protein
MRCPIHWFTLNTIWVSERTQSGDLEGTLRPKDVLGEIADQEILTEGSSGYKSRKEKRKHSTQTSNRRSGLMWRLTALTHLFREGRVEPRIRICSERDGYCAACFIQSRSNLDNVSNHKLTEGAADQVGERRAVITKPGSGNRVVPLQKRLGSYFSYISVLFQPYILS